jgi:hypothetical protein
MMDDAERTTREAADSGDPEAMRRLASLAADRGELDEAERWLRRAAGSR